MMTTKTVSIVSQVGGERLKAELVVCPDCNGGQFFIYTPHGMNHIHFQCVRCGVCFCDGCEAEGTLPTEAGLYQLAKKRQADTNSDPAAEGGAK